MFNTKSQEIGYRMAEAVEVGHLDEQRLGSMDTTSETLHESACVHPILLALARVALVGLVHAELVHQGLKQACQSGR